MMRFYFFLTMYFVLCYSCSNPETNTTATTATSGKNIYQQYCLACHGAKGDLQLNGAKNLTISMLNHQERIVQIKKGKNNMPAYEALLKDEEILAVVKYLDTLVVR